MTEPDISRPLSKIAPTAQELVEWLDWYQSNIIKSSSDRHWLNQCRLFIKERGYVKNSNHETHD
jgi:hypothetical protein